jgi:YVTN family beta-propeller protein
MIPRQFVSVDRLRRTLAVALVGLAVSAAAAAAAPKAYVGNFKDDNVSVVDTAAGSVLATVPVAAGPDGIVITRDGKSVYVSGSSASGVSVIDTAGDRVVQTIETGKGPQGLALTPDGRSLLIAVNGEDRVAVVDLATRAIVATIPVAKPHTIAVSPDGKFAYIASQDPGHFALVIVDLGKRASVGIVALDKPPRDLEFGHDGRALYFTLAGIPAVQVLDPASNKVVAQVATGVSPHIAAFFSNTSFGVVVVQGPGELQLFDPATNTATRSIPVGKQPHWVDVTADGTQAFVTNEGANSVTAIDLASGQTRTIAVGNAPRKIAVQPLANSGGSTAAKVSIANFAFVPADIAIHTGDTVVWSNDDGAPHGVAFADGAPGEPLMLPGASFRRRFDKPGTYAYACAVHSYMTARVTVQ